jgi:hypothetical protein
LHFGLTVQQNNSGETHYSHHESQAQQAVRGQGDEDKGAGGRAGFALSLD